MTRIPDFTYQNYKVYKDFIYAITGKFDGFAVYDDDEEHTLTFAIVRSTEHQVLEEMQENIEAYNLMSPEQQ